MASTAYSRSSKPGPAGERKPARLVKNLTKIEPKKLGIGLVAGCCLALLTYISLAKLFAIYSPVFASTGVMLQNTPPTSVPARDTLPAQAESGVRNETVEEGDVTEEKNEGKKEETAPKEPGFPEVSRKDEEKASTVPKLYESNSDGKSQDAKITCDDKSMDEGFPYARPDICEVAGDIRISPKRKTMFFVNPSGLGEFDANGEKKIRPYARKDDFLLPGVVEVTIKSVSSGSAAPQCTKNHNVPAVIFSVAGYTDNFFHDMTDVMIPLFLTSSHFKGEVQFLITNFKPWWVQKYTPLLRKLSNYEVINFDKDDEVHCFPHGYLGLFRDRDLIIYPHPTRNPHNYSMVDYTKFLRGAYDLKRERPMVLGEVPGKKPRMLIISRIGTRKLLNLDEVAALSEELGFEVKVAEPGPDVRKFAELVNSCDALLAVHGAGLTNQIFLPTEAVLVQIVPWGKMDWMATNFYGQPARDMKLRYVEYYVSEEETSLIDKYPRDHLVFKNPLAIHAQGWQSLAEIIMKQDVKVKLQRFRPFLLQALDKLQE